MSPGRNPIHELIQQLRQFRDERNWAQFHNPKDLALAISIEAAELNELFLWKSPEDADSTRVREELADVLLYAFQLADKYNWDVLELMKEKIVLNAKKYPVTPTWPQYIRKPLDTKVEIHVIPNYSGELINLCWNDDYGYLELESRPIDSSENKPGEGFKRARLKGKIDLLQKLLRIHVVNNRLKGGAIIVQEFLEADIPDEYKKLFNKKRRYEDAVLEYLKKSPENGEVVMSNGQRVFRFGIYLLPIPADAFDQYLVE